VGLAEGRRRETLEDAGISLARQYEAQGLDILPIHTQFEPVGREAGSVSVEAGLFDILTRMQTGRFKVFRHLNDWFEEFRLYHRKDGKVFKENDDLMSATRYGIMMLRFAEPEKVVDRHRRRPADEEAFVLARAEARFGTALTGSASAPRLDEIGLAAPRIAGRRAGSNTEPRDEDQPRGRAKAKREEPKREAARPKPAKPAARLQAATPRASGIGVGF
jgi:hypothetical protein